jgi:hypothetical protein
MSWSIFVGVGALLALALCWRSVGEVFSRVGAWRDGEWRKKEEVKGGEEEGSFHVYFFLVGSIPKFPL